MVTKGDFGAPTQLVLAMVDRSTPLRGSGLEPVGPSAVHRAT